MRERDENENNPQELIFSTMAMDRYPTLSVTHNENKSKTNWGLKIKDFHKILKNSLEVEIQIKLLEELEKLIDLVQQCKSNPREENVSNLKKEFFNLLTSVNLKVHESERSQYKSYFYKSIQINTAPDINEIGLGKTELEADICALEKIITSIKWLL